MVQFLYIALTAMATICTGRSKYHDKVMCSVLVAQ